eukprot:2684308-Rhodomonas_salina.1
MGIEGADSGSCAGTEIGLGGEACTAYSDSEAAYSDSEAGTEKGVCCYQDGRLLAWGNNIYGQLGIGKNITLEIDEISQDMDVLAYPFFVEKIPQSGLN